MVFKIGELFLFMQLTGPEWKPQPPKKILLVDTYKKKTVSEASTPGLFLLFAQWLDVSLESSTLRAALSFTAGSPKS